jgi:hypothetical protein
MFKSGERRGMMLKNNEQKKKQNEQSEKQNKQTA